MRINRIFLFSMYPPVMAPQANMFVNVPGYEGTVPGGAGFLPPPMPMEPVAPPQPSPENPEWSIPSLSEDEAREAFKKFVSSHICYSEDPVTQGVITSMEPFNTFRYRLETFTESRSTDWAHKPHEGEPADFYTQPAPRPWEVQATHPKHFSDHTEKIRVPYTSSIKECHTCHAAGTEQCKECSGSGKKACPMCNGAAKSDPACTHCNGTGKDRCTKCDGRGKKQCETCKGKCQLLTYIELKVEWKNHVEDHLVEQSCGLKSDKLRSVKGKELFKSSQNLVYPLLGFKPQAVSQASERLIKEHQTKYGKTSRILQQRQAVELIPITQVNYKWKDKSYVYYVYIHPGEKLMRETIRTKLGFLGPEVWRNFFPFFHHSCPVPDVLLTH
ncbi:protein SSUH2 homolog isoform X2 [Astatotilapia calliptera]|uniref:protein SSUH2 homolog isoform X2 n=1 Tax=Astatotilapia calliptera TaxID=8154 RepID=UPI000E40590A|nr:protein SSUH2 homolog isoform X2 [Astatotilapia calliptera]